MPTLIAAVLAGMCIGFLPHNFYPARIFMGDTGAMLIGLLLAYVPLSSTAMLDPNVLLHYSHTVNRYPTVLPMLLPVAILVIPYADLLMAVVRRTRAGMSPFAADKKHLHHRLLNIGHSHRQSVLIMYLWAALFTGAVASLSLVRTDLIVLVGLTLVAVLVLLPVTMPRLRPSSLAATPPAPTRPPGPPAPPGPAAPPPRPSPAPLRSAPLRSTLGRSTLGRSARRRPAPASRASHPPLLASAPRLPRPRLPPPRADRRALPGRPCAGPCVTRHRALAPHSRQSAYRHVGAIGPVITGTLAPSVRLRVARHKSGTSTLTKASARSQQSPTRVPPKSGTISLPRSRLRRLHHSPGMTELTACVTKQTQSVGRKNFPLG